MRHRVANSVTTSGTLTARIMFAGRSSSLSAQIVADVRDALFAKRLKPGDFVGTEKDLAARFGVSRIVARDALRTLEALGEMRDAGGARALMDDHVKMIRARRVAEHGNTDAAGHSCC